MHLACPPNRPATDLVEHAAAEVNNGIDAAELLEDKQHAAHQHSLPIGGTQQALASTRGTALAACRTVPAQHSTAWHNSSHVLTLGGGGGISTRAQLAQHPCWLFHGVDGCCLCLSLQKRPTTRPLGTVVCCTAANFLRQTADAVSCLLNKFAAVQQQTVLRTTITQTYRHCNTCAGTRSRPRTCRLSQLCHPLGSPQLGGNSHSLITLALSSQVAR